MRPWLAAVSLFCLAGCIAPDAHVPPFARTPYESFSRANAIAIANDEWRIFGSGIDDAMPGTRPRPTGAEKPERQPGLWERVGE